MGSFMKMKMIKGVTSEFEQHGFYLYNEATSYIEYASLTNDIRIVFDITNRRPRALRVFYAINIGGHWYPINLELFITGKKIQSEFFFENKQELLDFTDKLVHLIIDDILPCSKKLIDNPILSTHSMHKRLSADPQGLAKAFSEHYHFPLNSLKESFNLVKELLDGMVPSDIEKRPGAFHENEELMIGMAAYLGETAILEFNGSWKWLWSVPLPQEFDSIEKNNFVVVSSTSETCYFSPLGALESHWTFHNKVSAFGLNNFIRPW